MAEGGGGGNRAGPSAPSRAAVDQAVAAAESEAAAAAAALSDLSLGASERGLGKGASLSQVRQDYDWALQDPGSIHACG